MGGEHPSGEHPPGGASCAAGRQLWPRRRALRVKAARYGIDFAAARAQVRDALAAVAPEAFARALQRAGRARLVRRLPLHRSANGAVEWLRCQGAALHHRHRFLAGATGYSRSRRGAAISPPKRCSLSRTARATSSSSAPDAVGLELAQAFRRFGADGHRARDARRRLPATIRNARRSCSTALERDGVAVRSGVEIRARPPRDGRASQVEIAADGSGETIEGSHILVAAGRRPNIETLGLDAAGIRHKARGIAVDRRTAHQQQAGLCDRRGDRRARARPISRAIRPGSLSATRCSAPRSPATAIAVPACRLNRPRTGPGRP